MPFDCINLWVYGNNWAWVPDPTTPQVEIRVVLQNAAGTPARRDPGPGALAGMVAAYIAVSRRNRSSTLGDRPSLVGIEIVGGRNTSDRTLYFDNLASTGIAPAADVSAARGAGIPLPDGQTVGNNTGPGTLPFPTREETILPDNLTQSVHDVRRRSRPRRIRLSVRG